MYFLLKEPNFYLEKLNIIIFSKSWMSLSLDFSAVFYRLVGRDWEVVLDQFVKLHLAVGREHQEGAAHAQVGRHREERDVVQDGAHEEVERNPEDVDDGGPGLLRDVGAPHLHDGGPEEAHAGLEDAEGQNLQLACEQELAIFVRRLLLFVAAGGLAGPGASATLLSTML